MCLSSFRFSRYLSFRPTLQKNLPVCLNCGDPPRPPKAEVDTGTLLVFVQSKMWLPLYTMNKKGNITLV